MPAEFVAEEGPLKGLVLALEEKEEWAIGRDPDLCDLVVEDSTVSRKHLLCRKEAEGFVLENLSDTNPAKINNEPFLERKLLEDGDKVSIGKTIFHFYKEGMSTSFEMPSPEEVEEEAFMEPEEVSSETIFREEELPEPELDLTEGGRFVLKVIAGPNTGAEFALDLDKEYLIGTDAATCDIVFHDLSISRQHARFGLSAEGGLTIEDLGSRNGVIVDKERVIGKRDLDPNTVVGVGTSAFLVIDREAPAVTIAAPILEPILEEELPEEAEEVEAEKKAVAKPTLSTGTLILSLIIGGAVILLGVGLISLLRVSEVVSIPHDYSQEISSAVEKFPGVQFTYNKASSKLFLVGHVSTGIKKNELIYNLQGLIFIKNYEDNVVIDESVWHEMNILLSKISDFQGVSMHSPGPGQFVLTGYLQTNKQAAALTDYMNLNFAYLDKLENLVIVEEQVMEEVASALLQQGFNGVAVAFSNGELVLTGYISSTDLTTFQSQLDQFKQISGVRTVRNYVVALSPEQAVVDLNEKYPGRYQVTGFSKHGDVNINVVINGRMLTRGDSIDNMTITSIQPHTIFLEKEGLKYKVDYNK